jgi:uncharacterized RDD family membrane protein YckC
MTEPAGPRPGPIVLRLAAAIIDFTILIVVILPIQLIWTTGRTAKEALPTTGANVLAIVLFAGYPIVSTALYGCTVGKFICSLRVRRADGERCGWVRSIIRFAVASAPLFGFGILLSSLDRDTNAYDLVALAQLLATVLIYAPIFVDTRRRGVHDRVAGTIVITNVSRIVREVFGGDPGAPPSSPTAPTAPDASSNGHGH